MPTYSKAELVKAIKAQCNECNDVHGCWNATNDCTGKSCKLYPYRPGDGPGHAETLKKRKEAPETVAVRMARLKNVLAWTGKTQEQTTKPISRVGVKP